MTDRVGTGPLRRRWGDRRLLVVHSGGHPGSNVLLVLFRLVTGRRAA